MYTHPSDFFWKADLSEARRIEITDWVKSLPPDDKEKLRIIIADVRDQEAFDRSENE